MDWTKEKETLRKRGRNRKVTTITATIIMIEKTAKATIITTVTLMR